jgi:hypothetical protein
MPNRKLIQHSPVLPPHWHNRVHSFNEVIAVVRNEQVNHLVIHAQRCKDPHPAGRGTFVLGRSAFAKNSVTAAGLPNQTV